MAGNLPMIESAMDPQILNALRNLVPLNALTEENLKTLAQTTLVESYAPGTTLFQEGDIDDVAVYVLEGEVALNSVGKSSNRNVLAGTDAARYALAQLKPRQYTGKAKTRAVIARVDNVLMDRLLTWEQAAGYEVTEYEAGAEATDPEWMLGMLRSEVFQRLPTANVNALFSYLEPVNVRVGQVIIRQGDPGDYYYIVKDGCATVSRKSESTSKVVILDEIGRGVGFGEEALLSDVSRNATVVMKSDGVLMRLSKQAFDALLKAPLVKWVDENEAKAMVKNGAGIIDVRLEDEFRSGHLRGAVNIPLYLLRVKARMLNRGAPYVVYCQTGNRSASAAFLLTEQGFEVHVLKGGYQGLRHDQA